MELNNVTMPRVHCTG